VKKMLVPGGVLAAILAVVLLGGCKGADGSQGPQGPPGIDPGTFEGFATGIKCGTCHSSEQDTTYYVAGKVYQWELSSHGSGGAYMENRTTCAGCHTTEGFLERYRGGWSTQVTSQVNNPTPPGCFACHSPHARNNFSLRDTNAVTITSFITGVNDATFNYGVGNLCVRCHQTRTSSAMSPKPDPTKTAPTDTITITSSRWYPHYGVQGQMLVGTGGFQFQGGSYTGNGPHTGAALIQQEGCPQCHMADAGTSGVDLRGGHTMKVRSDTAATAVNLAGCRDAACHGSSWYNSGDMRDYFSQSSGLTAGVGVQRYIQRYLDTLYAMMTDTNVVGRWTVGNLKKPWLTMGAEGVQVNAGTSGGLTPLKIRPASRAGALYNYWFLEHDGSFGVHNSKYAVQLIQSSVAELRQP